jgi:hypothetical protein
MFRRQLRSWLGWILFRRAIDFKDSPASSLVLASARILSLSLTVIRRRVVAGDMVVVMMVVVMWKKKMCQKDEGFREGVLIEKRNFKLNACVSYM